MLNIDEIINKYKLFGLNKGGEFLIPIKQGISLIEDLGQINILILGCSLWKYVDQDKNWIVELLGAGFNIGKQPVTAIGAAMILKDLLLTKLPGDAELISLLFDDISVYEIFDHMTKS